MDGRILERRMRAVLIWGVERGMHLGALGMHEEVSCLSGLDFPFGKLWSA
jgi:hypothetical protein